MNRTIKFRAWHSKEKTMRHGVVVFPDGWVIDGETEDGYGDNGVDCFVMQFTGLLDRNGKEIYEGDIGFPSRISHKRFYVVRWCPTGTYGWIWALKNPKGEGGNTMFGERYDDNSSVTYSTSNGFMSDEWGCEVIGNIFENPDLLTPSSK